LIQMLFWNEYQSSSTQNTNSFMNQKHT
jgi:hypothetical protein